MTNKTCLKCDLKTQWVMSRQLLTTLLYFMFFSSLVFQGYWSFRPSLLTPQWPQTKEWNRRRGKLPFKQASGYLATYVMAAIDLERGLEHRGRGWGQERPELMDNFDSEMQEWEDQLQDIQRKIEEVRMKVWSQALCAMYRQRTHETLNKAAGSNR